MVYFENLSKSIIFSENSFILFVNFNIPTTVKLKSENGKRLHYNFQFDEIKKLLERKNIVGRIYHVGLTVSDLDRSIAFYRDILGLEFQSEILMEGEEIDKMFRKENCKARVAFLNGSKALEVSPVELIQFVDSKIHKE